MVTGVPPSGSGHSALQPEPVSRLGLSASVPNAALLQGPKYSPNLRAWFVRHGKRAWRKFGAFREADGTLFVGYAEDDGYFCGNTVNSILLSGRKADIWAYGHLVNLQPMPEFWDQYERFGRCAIDTEHRRCFVGDETRWLTDGDTRSCLWCGNHTQHLRRWTETVPRERWEPASAIEAPSGVETAQTGSTEGESAAPSGETPND